jgi:hypothetical protein
MHDAINDYRGFFDLEQNPIIANAQAIFGREVGQMLDVPS